MALEIKTLPLSFCGEEVQNIVNSEAKQHIIDNLEQNYNVKISDKRAYILNNKSVYFLEKTQHIISIKSSGTNYYLFFTNINNTNYCLFIDRKIKQGYTLPRIITADFKFHDDLFSGTVFDGEIVRDREDNWMFLISNIVALKGRVVNSNMVARMNLIYKVLAESYSPDPVIDICPIRVKRVYRYSDYDRLILMYIPKFEYEIKGMFFNSLTNKHSNHLFMMSAPSKKEGYTDRRKTRSTGATAEVNANNSEKVDNAEVVSPNPTPSSSSDTLVFQVKTTDKPEIYELHGVNDKKVVEIYSVALIKKMAVSKKLKAYFDNTEKSGNCFCDCKFNTRFKKWEVIGINENAKIAANITEIKNLEEE